MGTENKILDWALYYRSLGWRVIPVHTIVDGKCTCGKENCKSPGKHPHPLAPNGLKDGTADESVIRKWFSDGTHLNIGICTGADSKLVVLDIDPAHGGNESLAMLEQEHGKLADTLEVLTGGNGRHLYFRHPDGIIKNSAGRLGEGLDIRADGGYVVAPPSAHITGKTYRWKADPKHIQPASLPDWLLSRVIETKQRRTCNSDIGAKIPEGRRNDTLMSKAGMMRRNGFEEEAIYAAIAALNEKHCNPPLSPDEVENIAKSVCRYEPQESYGKESDYEATEGGLIYYKWMKDNLVQIPVTNFSARIISEVTYDDGSEKQQFFEIEADLQGQKRTCQVAAPKFSAMNWSIEQLGHSAVIYAGHNKKDHARTAIQLLSKNVQKRTVYTHTGWREIDGQWVYLIGNGAIGKDGYIEGVEVNLPSGLDKYTLSCPRDAAEQIEASRASLRFLDAAEPFIAFPLFCAIWRSILGGADYSVHLSGGSGSGKSTIAALALNHLGRGFKDNALPASWSSTANALEVVAFNLKDCPCVIDDFKPSGSLSQQQMLYAAAERLLRSQGNRAGRQRLRADATLKPVKPPRGLIISTGEDLPLGQSIRARCQIIEVQKDDVWQHQDALTECQLQAANGLYEKTMFGYICWLASNYEVIHSGFAAEMAELRAKVTIYDAHKRTPGIFASQFIGLKYFVDYARSVGAIKEQEANALLGKAWQVLADLGRKQTEVQQSEDPALRFIALLTSAICSGQAHIARMDGREPQPSEGFGWRSVGSEEDGLRRPMGERIGWTDGDCIYLDPDAAFKIALAADRQNPIATSLRTLKARLVEKGLVVRDTTRNTITVRHVVECKRMELLQLSPSVSWLEDNISRRED